MQFPSLATSLPQNRTPGLVRSCSLGPMGLAWFAVLLYGLGWGLVGIGLVMSGNRGLGSLVTFC